MIELQARWSEPTSAVSSSLDDGAQWIGRIWHDCESHAENVHRQRAGARDRVALRAGAATGWHRHEMDYVVVPMLDGELELVGPDGGRVVRSSSKACPTFATPGSSTT